MAQEINYSDLYNKAYAAYGQGNYKEAAEIIQPMAEAEAYRDNPDVLLLRGHISLSLEQYEQAYQHYQSVLQLTNRQDLRDLAQQGLERAQQFLGLTKEPELNKDHSEAIATEDSPEDWGNDFQINEDAVDWDFDEDDFGEPTIGHDPTTNNPFQDSPQTTFEPSQGKSPFSGDLPPETPDNWQIPNTEDIADFPFADEYPDEEQINTQVNGMAEPGPNTFVVSPPLENRDLEDANRSTPSQGFNGNSLKPSAYNSSNDSADDASNFEATASMPSSSETNQASFIDNLEALNEEQLKELSNFELTEVSGELPDTDIFTGSSEKLSNDLGLSQSELLNNNTGTTTVSWVKPNEVIGSEAQEGLSSFAKPMVDVSQQPWSAWFINASFKTKPWIAAGITGIVSFVAVLLVGILGGVFAPKPEANTSVEEPTEQVTPEQSSDSTSNTSEENGQSDTEPSSSPKGSPILLMALVGGVGSFGTALLLGLISASYVKQTVNDLQAQFDAMYAGDFNVKATVYSEDELGKLSISFNQLARIVLTTTSEAQQRAAEIEQAREDLQRQVIRLLDDVEGAARGDLTVEAVVTADVLGAVADAFNLTIQNLREIVGQVKQAAKQVNKGSTDSESFARNNSSDALRMAEELAVTLNSVQVMTQSIQRVAENAREAEEVAHTSSISALKGGEAVERTVAGILGIRETVSDTTRKVKRLAEASQEISKIVALISQIASRTNLLALNASIQAARAGEAGRGFAIVADEVRQLADRSAKSLKEIEQIVLQIQSETGSVMTAMEEGIQQVINLVDTSEQAKTSLEDIIDVSNRINSLVRSITADTIQQRENSRAVTQVMQSVELTAQETSHESQRVAGSLQNLVAISRDLLASVERFRVDKNEN